MKIHSNSLALLFSSFILGTSFGQTFISSTYINTIEPSVLMAVSGLSLTYSVDTYKIVYETTDVDGSATVASGAFCIPVSPDCQGFPIAVYEHGTSLRKVDVPSEDIQETYIGRIFAAGGYQVVMPDYLGMGESPGLHPYCHGASEATATLDMIRAVREAQALGEIPGMEPDNGELFLTGYSQGGHAAMATHKYIEENNLLEEFNVIASAPCSGPYEITGAMADTILAASYSNPGYIVYIMASYQRVYGDLYTSYSDVLKAPYDEIVEPYFNGNNYTLGMGSLNEQLPQEIQSFVEDSVLENFLAASDDLSHPIWQAMAANDNHDWLPTRPIKMFYCTGDEQVSFQNALVAESTMLENGATDVEAVFKGEGMHNDCVLPSLTDAFTWFESLKTACSLSIEYLEIGDVEVFPNPIQNTFRIETEDFLNSNVSILDQSGRVVYEHQDLTPNCEIDISNLTSGCYFLMLNNVNKSITIKLIKA
ncbi:MAG: alpha/beta fold hydrolase [Crocinitomicaceae bacterium]|mgnify:CR=1 FL=1|nr:alpha/beta fold hydrolase [Crocinitomicaceae bacterium]MDG1736245.1 alpha/beta fold hydrolase [Crocinitomicaceae bacterium]MDG2504840.1 alpha/beta fold hydrolase [Crocinitomicaceae bacterium]